MNIIVELKKWKGFVKKHSNYLVYTILVFILWFSGTMRISNISLLKDVTTGKPIPIELDTFAFHRYSEYILQHGSLMINDVMRYYPLGYDPRAEFGFLAYFHAYTYKILHIFFSNLTFDFWFIIYPVVCFLIMLIAFFFLVKVLFDKRVALLSTAFLAFSPPFLFRTIAGFSDKEAFALMTMTFAMLFYVCSWKTKSTKNAIIFGIAAGIFTAFTALAWGGVLYLILLFGIIALVEILFGKYSDNDLYAHFGWYFAMVLVSLFFQGRIDLASFLFGGGMIPSTASVLFGLADRVFRKYETPFMKKLYEGKLPRQLFVYLLVIILGVLAAVATSMTVIFLRVWKFIYVNLIQPEGMGRWGLTVAESRVTYVSEWLGHFNNVYFYLMIIAALVIIYVMVKHIKKYWYFLFTSLSLFLIAFIFSKYSNNSIFNGATFTSKLFLFGGFTVMILTWIFLYFYGFYKNKELYSGILKIDKVFLFLLIWFLIAVVGAKAKVRLVMMLSPITSILVSYLTFYLYDFIKKFEIKPFKLFPKPLRLFSLNVTLFSRMINLPLKPVKVIAIVFLFALILSPFAPIVNSIPILNKVPVINNEGILVSFAKLSYNQAQQMGPTVSQQWQKAMSWVRENTPEDSVFGHWWDYGYWVQGLGKRTTISDGGNSRGAINYFTGRYLMTGTNDTETLEFLYANGVDYILMEGADIGKYPAYSSIGSDVNYDRYSWINPFIANPEKSQKKDDLDYIIYEGNFPLDEDFTYNGVKYHRKTLAVIAFLIPFSNKQSGLEVKSGIAALYNLNNNQVFEVPLNCIFYNGNELIYNNSGLNGCFIILPEYKNNNLMNPIGAGIYVSERVRKGMFTRYYLYGGSSKNFELVYSDHDSSPLFAYGGMLLGPLRIWKVNYPKDIKDNPLYRQTTLPDDNLYYVNSTYQ